MTMKLTESQWKMLPKVMADLEAYASTGPITEADVTIMTDDPEAAAAIVAILSKYGVMRKKDDGTIRPESDEERQQRIDEAAKVKASEFEGDPEKIADALVQKHGSAYKAQFLDYPRSWKKSNPEAFKNVWKVIDVLRNRGAKESSHAEVRARAQDKPFLAFGKEVGEHLGGGGQIQIISPSKVKAALEKTGWKGEVKDGMGGPSATYTHPDSSLTMHVSMGSGTAFITPRVSQTEIDKSSRIMRGHEKDDGPHVGKKVTPHYVDYMGKPTSKKKASRVEFKGADAQVVADLTGQHIHRQDKVLDVTKDDVPWMEKKMAAHGVSVSDAASSGGSSGGGGGKTGAPSGSTTKAPSTPDHDVKTLLKVYEPKEALKVAKQKRLDAKNYAGTTGDEKQVAAYGGKEKMIAHLDKVVDKLHALAHPSGGSTTKAPAVIKKSSINKPSKGKVGPMVKDKKTGKTGAWITKDGGHVFMSNEGVSFPGVDDESGEAIRVPFADAVKTVMFEQGWTLDPTTEVYEHWRYRDTVVSINKGKLAIVGPSAERAKRDLFAGSAIDEDASDDPDTVDTSDVPMPDYDNPEEADDDTASVEEADTESDPTSLGYTVKDVQQFYDRQFLADEEMTVDKATRLTKKRFSLTTLEVGPTGKVNSPDIADPSNDPSVTFPNDDGAPDPTDPANPNNPDPNGTLPNPKTAVAV